MTTNDTATNDTSTATTGVDTTGMAMDRDRLVLAIDTSSDIAVAVASGTEVLARTLDTDRHGHVENLAGLIDATLKEAGVPLPELTGIVVGMGPGPFTGLRVGIATAETLAWAHSTPLHRVCSLDVVGLAWAADAQPSEEFVVASDARRKELYWGRYAPDGTRIGNPTVSAPEALPDLVVVGPGADIYPGVHRDRKPIGPRTIDPGLLALEGPGLPEVGDTPLYLRRPDAVAPTSRKSTLVRRKRLALRQASS